MKSSPSIWCYVVNVKLTVKISSILVASLENMNFISVGKNIFYIIILVIIYFRIKTTFNLGQVVIICPSVSYDTLLTQNSQYIFFSWLSDCHSLTWQLDIILYLLTYLNLLMYLFDIYILKEKFYEKWKKLTSALNFEIST